jgi:HdeA/HdeB family
MLSRWQIAAWLSGYSHAKSNNLIIDLESFEENVNKLTNYCYDEKNFKVPIMEAIVRVLGKLLRSRSARRAPTALLAKPVNGINAPQRPDCVAGHVRFEPANPSARYLIGFA